MTQISDYKSRLLRQVEEASGDLDPGAQRLLDLAGSDDQVSALIARLVDPDASEDDKLAALNDLHVVGNFSKVLPTRSAEATNALRGLIKSPNAEVRRQALTYLALLEDEVALDHLRREISERRAEGEKSVPTHQAIAMLSAFEKGVDKKLLIDVVEDPPDEESLVQAVRHMPADEETVEVLTRVLEDESRSLAARALVPDLVNNVAPSRFAAAAKRILEQQGPDSEIAPYVARGVAGIRQSAPEPEVDDVKAVIRDMGQKSSGRFRQAADLLSRQDKSGSDE